MPDLHMFLPPEWRSTDEAEAIHARIAAAEQAGLSVLAERHRFEWRSPAADAVPLSSDLSFESAPADDDVIALLFAISEGSLDAGTRRSVEQGGADGAARSYFADMADLPGGREHWLLGRDPTGAAAGVVVASMQTQPHPQIAFVGVAPGHRGRGDGAALVTEATRRLVAAGAEVVRADTDMSNVPMIAVFEQCGWRAWATRLVMHLPA